MGPIESTPAVGVLRKRVPTMTSTIQGRTERAFFLGKTKPDEYQTRGRSNVTAELALTVHERIEGWRTIDLEPITQPYYELSICGTITTTSGRRQTVSAGQMDFAAEVDVPGTEVDIVNGPRWSRADIDALAAMWRRWHLNGTKAGTRVQDAWLAEHHAEDEAGRLADRFHSPIGWRLDNVPADRGYRYGSAWLVELLPADVLAVARHIRATGAPPEAWPVFS
jgi:hypothetical protein